jgi:hypothetical protein
MRLGLKLVALVIVGIVATGTASMFRTCAEYNAYMRYGDADAISRHEELKKWRERHGLDGQLRPVTRPSLDEP